MKFELRNKLLFLFFLLILAGFVVWLGFKKLSLPSRPESIEFLGIDCPSNANPGEIIRVWCRFRSSKRIESHKMFVHLLAPDSREVLSNADVASPIPTSDWKPGREVRIGPILIKVPEQIEMGTYPLRVGFFKRMKTIDGPVYVRIPYDDPLLADHVLAHIKIPFPEDRIKEIEIHVKKLTDYMEANFLGQPKEPLAGSLSDLREKLDEVGEEIKVNPDDIQKVMKTLDIIEEKIERICLRMCVLEISGDRSGGFGFFLVSPMVKFSDDFFDVWENRIPGRFEMAANEYEGFQVVVFSGKEPVKELRIEFENLKDGKGNIFSKENFEWLLMEMVQTSKPDYPVSHVGMWPDPLVRAGPQNLPEKTAETFWIRFYAPASQGPGIYQGHFLVSSRLFSRKVPITIRIWNFKLPLFANLRTAFGFYPSQVSRYYGLDRSDADEMIRKYRIDLLKHRITPIEAVRKPRLLRSKEGSFVDFSQFHDDIQEYLKYGLRFVAVCGFGHGKWYRKKNVKLSLELISDYLKKMGWDRYAYLYAFDEPGLKEASNIVKFTKLVHEINPKIKTLITSRPLKAFGKHVDIWCPRMFEYNLSEAEIERARGKQVWWYVSSAARNFPSLNIDMPGIHPRILPWIMWKYKVDGLLSWCVNWWRVDPWKSAETWPRQNGGGMLFYPGKDGPVDSIRIENLRDGLEDYEYFFMLRQKTKLLQMVNYAGRYDELLQEAGELLQIKDTIIQAPNDFSEDPADITEHRREMGDVIHQIIEILNAVESEMAKREGLFK